MTVPDVLVVSYRRVYLLESCLDSIGRHLPGATVRVWDNHSDASEDVQAFADRRDDIDWHFSPENIGFAAAVNRLMERVEATSALLLNPDATLLCDLELTRAALDDVDVAAAAPWLRENGRRPWDNAHREPNLVRELVSYLGWDDRLGRAAALSASFREAPSEVPGYLTGACLLLSMRAWREVGPFDEDYFLYGEEADWCRRARDRGFRLVLAPEVGVAHSAGGTVSDATVETSRSRQLLDENRRRYLTRHHGRMAGSAFAGASALIERVQPSKVRAHARARDASSPDVVITTPTLDFGGAERQRVQLANALVERGLKVRLRVLQHTGGMAAELDPRVELVVLGYRHVRRDAGSRTLLVTGTTRIESVYGLAWRALNHPNGRWVAANHAPAREDRPTFAPDVNAVLRRSDGIIHLADIHRELHQQQYDLDRGRYWIVPNGVPVRAPRTPRPSEDGVTRFVVASRIEEYKQIHLLVEAFSEGLDDLPWTLDIWGDGGYRDEVAAGIPPRLADRIRMRGWTNDVAGVLETADVYCLPSRAEAQPMVILEAMEATTCVASAPVASVPEVLADGAGVLVEPPSVESWRRVIRMLIADPELRRRTALTGRRRVEERYSIDAMTERYLRLHEEVFVGRAD